MTGPKKDYTVQELTNNLSFRRMIEGKAGDKEENEWDHWIEADEEHREKARRAASKIAGFAFKDPEQPDVDKAWNQLYKNTVGKKGTKSKKTYKKSSSLLWIYRVAAVLVAGLLVSWGVYMYSGDGWFAPRGEQITITTASNETTTITFSGGSKAVLSSNSKLTYRVGGASDQTIDIILNGEAYFQAESSRESSSPVFAVHTSSGVIRDIGTQFLVTVQHERTRVVLQEGKVRIKPEDKTKKNQIITVGKDKMAIFNKMGVLQKEKVNPTFYTAWSTGYIDFDQTTIKKFTRLIERRFDVSIKIVDSKLADIKLDGSIYFKTFKDLVFAVAKVANIRAYRSNNKKTIYLESKI